MTIYYPVYEYTNCHPSHNDYHYYGDWTDKLIPTVTEEIVIIKEDARLTVFCEEDGTTLKYGK